MGSSTTSPADMEEPTNPPEQQTEPQDDTPRKEEQQQLVEKTADPDDNHSSDDSKPDQEVASSVESSLQDDDDEEDVIYYDSSRERMRHYVSLIQTVRFQCGRLVNNYHVQLFIVTLIAINAIMMGIGTFEFVWGNPVVDNAFETVDMVFLIIFTVELAMQFIYLGWRLILDGWLLFDLIIIVLSWSFSSVQIIRAFRIFRALRLITRIKVMKNLVLALFGVMPRMFAIGLLLFLVSYIFAVMFTQLFKDVPVASPTNEYDYTYFGRLDQTFFTLFQIMTLDAWANVARDVMAVYAWAWLPFIIFVIITGFVVVNLIIAVICDAISALHDDEKAKLHGTFDDHTEVSDSAHPGLQEDVREQLDVLENHVDELAQMQAKTLATLQLLAHHVREQRAVVKHS